jgi:hypothetical protein
MFRVRRLHYGWTAPSGGDSRLRNVLWDGDSRLEELAAIEDSEELCRQLLASPSGWGSSTSHVEAVELLGRVHGTAELPGSFVALLLCTCRRWDRVTARLIVAIEDSGLLSDADLDELAECFFAHEHVISYPLAWVSPQWLEVDVSDGTSRTYTVDENTLAKHRLSFEPPLRRWGAQRALRAAPARLDQLLNSAETFQPRHRDAFIHGLLDAADVLEEAQRRRLIRSGLQTARASVRCTALDQLCALDGSETARRRAHADTNASVRKWRPRVSESPTPSLFGP